MIHSALINCVNWTKKCNELFLSPCRCNNTAPRKWVPYQKHPNANFNYPAYFGKRNIFTFIITMRAIKRIISPLHILSRTSRE